MRYDQYSLTIPLAEQYHHFLSLEIKLIISLLIYIICRHVHRLEECLNAKCKYHISMLFNIIADYNYLTCHDVVEQYRRCVIFTYHHRSSRLDDHWILDI